MRLEIGEWSISNLVLITRLQWEAYCAAVSAYVKSDGEFFKIIIWVVGFVRLYPNN